METIKIAQDKFTSLAVRSLEPKRLAWWRLGLLTVSTVYFYVFMEWLFFVTKPSFMDVMNLGSKIEVLFFTGLFLLLLVLPALALFFGLSYLPWLSRRWDWFLYASVLVPAGILTVASLLLVDNFTYTVLRWGIVSTQGLWRGLYGALFLLAFILWYRWLLRHLRSRLEATQAGRPLLAVSMVWAGVILVSSVLAFPQMDIFSRQPGGAEFENTTGRPHILLLGGDGLNATRMSAYGYERDTTPNLQLLAGSSLVAENAFTNSINSPGSILSILTGKHPLSTRVVYPPDILRGSDAYQHLPGILRGIGYRNIEIGVSHYIDVYNLNLRDGFDMVNKRTQDQAGFQFFAQLTSLEDTAYFLSVIAERISDRIQHIFLLEEMTNPYQEVTSTESNASDNQRIQQLLKLFKQADQPLFIHVHMMGTHGPNFVPREQVFSAGQSQDAYWMPDFYDDAVLDFDRYVGRVWSELTKMGLLEETIIIIYSDHPHKYYIDERIPLIFRFPHEEHAGTIRNNVQNLDIAPTILDYLGVPIPEWMEGQSLLAGEPDPTRPIFTTGATEGVMVEGHMVVDLEHLRPPFYQFKFLSATVCQNWYQLFLTDYDWVQGKVQGHIAPCDDPPPPEAASAQEIIWQRLEVEGFDTTALKTHFVERPAD